MHIICKSRKNLAAFSPDVATAKFGRDIAGFSPGDGSPSGNLRDLVSPASSQGVESRSVRFFSYVHSEYKLLGR